MKMDLTPQESSALYRLLAENTSDIILKTDPEGFIVHASPAMERLGISFPNMLIGPHILDLVHPSCKALVREQHDVAIRGRSRPNWVEFRAVSEREQWFEMQLRRLQDDDGHVYGALGVMRSIEERRFFEDKLFATAMTDPLTGLTNRHAFLSMLQHLVDRRAGGCVAMFDIDHFKAINMRYGHSIGDRVLVAFSTFLRTLLRPDDIISRIGDGALGVLLPGTMPDQAESVCRRVIAALADIPAEAGGKGVTITASGGVARIEESSEDTIRRAELALFLAKAKGRNRLEVDTGMAASCAGFPALF